MSDHNTIRKSTNLNKRKTLLQATLAEVVDLFHSRSDLVIETSADVLDTIQMIAQRDVLAQRIDINSRILGEVRAALDNIDTGEYGVCEDCNGLISPRRLDAIPWARVCVKCQEIRDHKGTLEHLNEFPMVA